MPGKSDKLLPISSVTLLNFNLMKQINPSNVYRLILEVPLKAALIFLDRASNCELNVNTCLFTYQD